MGGGGRKEGIGEWGECIKDIKLLLFIYVESNKYANQILPLSSTFIKKTIERYDRLFERTHKLNPKSDRC